MPTTLQLTYYPWITQSISGNQLAVAIRAFSSILEKDLSNRIGGSVTVEVLSEMDVADQITHVRIAPQASSAGTLALMNPLGYAVAHRSEPAVTTAAVVRRRIPGFQAGPTYRAQIYANALTGIVSIEDLRRRSFAFGSAQSTSSFLVPAHMLWRVGIHPLHAFSRLEFAGGHDVAAKAVYEGRIDAGAGHDGVIVDLAAKRGFSNAAERLVRVAWSDEIPSDPIVVHVPDADLRRSITDSLCAVAPPTDSTSDGNIAIKDFWGTTEGLEPIGADAYESLLSSAADLGLRPEDMLRRS